MVSFVLISFTPDDIIQQIKDALHDFNVEYPAEKIYVQTDKTYYKPSESVWYKGFLSNGTDNKPSVSSDVVYMELLDPRGNIIERHEQNVVTGTFNGVFNLSPDHPGGIYRIVGYTTWMKNWGEDYFFSKEITVQKVITPRLLLKIDFEKRAYGAGDEVVANLKITDLNNIKTTGSTVKSTIRIGGKEYKTLKDESKDGEAAVRFSLPANLNTADGILQVVVADKGVEESITRSIPIVINKIEMQFFPEGGDLIAETDNRVAFQALNEFGKGADISGEIIDESGLKVTDFASFHLGMGSFTFKPGKGKKYYARIAVPVGNGDLKELPKSVDNGYRLTLSQKDSKKTTWKIYSPKDNANMAIIAHTQGIIQYSKALYLRQGENEMEVNTSDFPIGVAVFTLFDGTKEVAERLVFLNDDKRLNIKLTTDKEYYAPEEEVKLSIETSDDKGNPVSANIGLAVVDEQILTMADDKQDNILSSMLLSSELKGRIEEPSFYFNPEEPKAKEAIDYLMLTHGWRRFQWPEVLSNTPPFEVKNLAERFGSVYGYILDKNGNPVGADVYLIEFGGKRRIARLNTTKEGHFVFHNVDMTNGVHVSTKLPNRVYLIDGMPVIAKKNNEIVNTEDGGIIDLSKKSEDVKELDRSDIRKDEYTEIIESFQSDQSALEEVLVVGYGIQQRRTLSAAVSVVHTEDLKLGQDPNDITSALAGVVPGIMVNSQNTVPGSSSNIRIRGTSSITTTEPLVVIDGIPVEGSFSQAMSMVNPSDIESVEVLKSVNGSAIYGSRASNGVILLTSKRARFKQKYKPPTPEYSGATVAKRQFYKAPGFLQETHNPSRDNSTVYWNGNIYAGKEGKAVAVFYNNKQSSTFRITAEGRSPADGLIASVSKRIVTQEEFSIDAKVPLFAGCMDIIKVPVMLKNMTDRPLDVKLYFDVDKPLSITFIGDFGANNIVIPPNMTETVYMPFIAEKNETDVNITISARSEKYNSDITRKLTIRQVNFPYQYNFSGRQMNHHTQFNLPDYIGGTLKAEAITYVEIMDELFDGAEGIFREPHGCFEQLLSSSFPNVFALQLLKATGKIDNNSHSRAMGYIESGYNRLANYEVKKTGGFEWYGGSPAHEMLTAYGLVHFYEMEKIYDKVDKKMTDRALEFLLSRRNGNGGFKQNRGRYGFSGAPANVNNAYIVYAFNEIEKGDLVEAEYKSALQEALESKDIYRMALLANVAYHRKDVVSYKKLITHFKEIAGKGDLSKLNIQATIVYSYGEYANREAVAYWVLALLKDTANYDHQLVRLCLEYISKGKTRYGFGNTQTTSVCLQALTKYALFAGANMIQGDFCLQVDDDKECINLRDKIDKKQKTSIPFTDKLKKGTNDISISYVGSDTPYSYVVNVSWYTAMPPSSKLCPLELTTNINAKEIKVNETVRLSVRLKNTENLAKPMSVAIIGIPGGMSLQPWQLKEMLDKEVFDFYEITNDNLVIYYRELGPREEKIIDLDLKAEIPGVYTGMASSAYVYYMNEHKYWLEGIKVNIKE